MPLRPARRGTTSTSFRRTHRRRVIQGRGLGMFKSLTTRMPKFYNFKRNTNFDIALDTPMTTPVKFGANEGVNGYFSLNDLPNVTEFTSLFDSYRLMAVKMTWMFSSNVVNYGTALASGTVDNNYGLPVLYWCRDHDDGNALTTIDQMREYQDFKCRRMDKPITIFIRPRTTSSVYKGGLADGFKMNTRKAWIDCSNPDVQYYGLKFAIDINCPGATDDDVIGHINVETKYYFQCKDPR